MNSKETWMNGLILTFGRLRFLRKETPKMGRPAGGSGGLLRARRGPIIRRGAKHPFMPDILKNTYYE